jgi:Flp pilus assembly protein TadG
MGTKMKLIAAKARAFLRAKRGNVAMIFAISMIPLAIAAGVGLDFSRAMLVRQQMGEALDAAALAIGSTTGLTQATAQTLAQQYFNANYTVDKTAFGTPATPIVTYSSSGSVQLSVTNNMPTVLVKLVGITTLPVAANSTVVWGQSKLWVGLVLDNSGSMSQGDSSGSKMNALQSASHQLLTILQNASTNPGDVQVGIVPFTRSINMGESSYVSNAAMDWGEWDAPPVAPGSTTVLVQPGNIPLADTFAITNVISGSPSTIVFAAWGPGDSCPFTNASSNQMSPFGFNCVSNATNGASNINTIASSGSAKGLICPGIDSGTYNTAHNARYYNGCYTSTKGVGTIVVATGSSAVCKLSNGVGFSSTNCSCATVSGVKTCSTQKWVHAWVSNAHSTWSGCVMDRQRSGIQTMTTSGLRTAPLSDYDTSNTQASSSAPDSQFPAENPASCPAAAITVLGYNWTTLGTQIDAMAPGGSTNQAIGVEHGWQMLTPGVPYATPAVPANTARYIILLSDGLNTQDRWWGDGSTELSTQDGYIDTREKNTCDAAKADGVVIYTIFLDIGGAHGDSAPLQYCATDSSKYYDLTSTTGVVTAFNQIAQQITNVRVSH